MKSSIYVERPDRQDFTLSTTMMLKEWKEVRKALHDNGDFTARCFADHIRKLVDKAEQLFDEYSQSAPEPDDG